MSLRQRVWAPVAEKEQMDVVWMLDVPGWNVIGEEMVC